MRNIWRAAAATLAVMTMTGGAYAADPDSCKTVRLSDIGWTDITSTTAMTAQLLKGLGYTPKIDQLSEEVTYTSMKKGDTDVFLGDWEPSMTSVRKPYVDDGSVVVLDANLPEGAKYTLAVPQYTYDKGLKDFADIAKFKDSLQGKIYGIEPGNDGNGIVLDLIKKNTDGLGGFQLVESSEQGMLAQVDRATRRNDDIVFLGWAPHPMNVKYKMQYLTGGDDSFGPDFGAAKVYTNERKDWASQCPNAAKLIANMKFSVDMENTWMDKILNGGEDPAKVATDWLKANPGALDTFLAGVTTVDGQPGEDAVKKSLGI